MVLPLVQGRRQQANVRPVQHLRVRLQPVLLWQGRVLPVLRPVAHRPLLQARVALLQASLAWPLPVAC